MQTSVQLKSNLDKEVKTIQGLLQKLTAQERVNYIKEMIPTLLSAPQQITDNSQRLTEKQLTPFNNLSTTQRKQIEQLTQKTEMLFKLMSDKN